MRKISLHNDFPFKEIFDQFLFDYSHCLTYWYVPKARVLDKNNVTEIIKFLNIIFEKYLEKKWTREIQDSILNDLIKEKIVDPYRKDSKMQDRTALVRILTILLETLGLLWIKENMEIIITDVGFDLISSENFNKACNVIENQIAKYQYPNPISAIPYNKHFKGILPHLFLLQILRECDFKISSEEFKFFINLAQEHTDLEKIKKYILAWRELGNNEKEFLRNLLKKIPFKIYKEQKELISLDKNIHKTLRYEIITQDSSYQDKFYCFPKYLQIDEDRNIACAVPDQLNEIIEKKLGMLKVSNFIKKEDWFSYYGDPKQKPSWFTHLSLLIELSKNEHETEYIVNESLGKLTDEEKKEIVRKQVEKAIETFYSTNLSMLENGLILVEDGRQYSTPIGRIDLLCKGKDGKYVVVEVKATEAEDSVFGQILRYIGWIHRNIPDGENNVRGIILASEFTTKARYSRIGLLKENHKYFIQFKEHKLNVSDI